MYVFLVFILEILFKMSVIEQAIIDKKKIDLLFGT